MVSSAGTKKRKRNGSRSGASGRGGVEAPVAAQSPVVLSVSGQMDAIELRDEVVRLRKEMNTLTKERDVAKAQQVGSTLLVSGTTSIPFGAHYIHVGI